jgi:hypothetical protein
VRCIHLGRARFGNESGAVRVFRQKFTLEDAIGSHACSLEASRRVTNGILLGSSLFLPVHTVNCVQTLKVKQSVNIVRPTPNGRRTVPKGLVSPLPIVCAKKDTLHPTVKATGLLVIHASQVGNVAVTVL